MNDRYFMSSPCGSRSGDERARAGSTASSTFLTSASEGRDIPCDLAEEDRGKRSEAQRLSLLREHRPAESLLRRRFRVSHIQPGGDLDGDSSVQWERPNVLGDDGAVAGGTASPPLVLEAEELPRLDDGATEALERG